MMTLASNLVRIALPDDDWRAVEISNGTAFARAGDLADGGGDVRWASFTLWIGAVAAEAGAALHDVAEELMSRRVRQGYPERFSAVVAGVPALGYEYGDGVAAIRSYFVSHPTGVIVEIALASMYWPSGELKFPLEPAAERLLPGVQWR